jgi:catalase
MRNPVGRANYEPNSWGSAGGPREDPARGFRSYAEEADGQKLRIRPESFADHYSQARQFFISQTAIEQKHIGDALVFELSKVERTDIRARMVSHLINIDATLAATVADGLALGLPDAAQAVVPTIMDLPASDALSIVKNGPQNFKGRKLGILLTDGSDAALFAALTKALDKEQAVFEVIAPKVGGVTLSDGTVLAAKHKIDGGPSILFDAVAVLPSEAGAARLAIDKPAKDFVSDAFAHCKYIGIGAASAPLFDKAGLTGDLDEGCLPLASAKDIDAFLMACANGRYWPRELNVDLDAKSGAPTPEDPKIDV